MERSVQVSRYLPHWRLPAAAAHLTWWLRSDQRDLSSPERAIVAATLKRFEIERYGLHAYAVMNDHVDVLVTPAPPFPPGDLVRSWQSVSASRMRRVLGRRGAVWNAEYCDRPVRTRGEYDAKVRYILCHPLTRWPGLPGYPWSGLGEAGRRESGRER